MPRATPSIDRIVNVIIDAEILGIIETAKKWGIHRRTVWDYKRQAQSNKAISHRLTQEKAKMAERWVESAGRILDQSINKMGELINRAESVSDLRYLTDLVEKVGNLKLGVKVLDSSDPEVGETEEAPRDTEG